MYHSKPKSFQKIQINLKNHEEHKEQSEVLKLKSEIAAIEKDEDYYKQNPELHPLYKHEWSIYWSRRCAELKRDGINNENYNFTSEWSEYWKDYITKHYECKIDEIQKKIRRISHEHAEKPISYVSLSSSDDSGEDDYGRDKRKRVNTHSGDSGSEHNAKDLSGGPVSLISVLRILSVFEDDLGSVLSTKIIDLLTKSLELERSKANSSEEMLMTRDNVAILETCKEKLKGLLMVELLPSKKVITAVKKCIQNIAQLVHQTPLGKDFESINPERKRIADMIEKEVRDHGETNLTPLELDVLVDVYLDAKVIQQSNSSNRYESFTDQDLQVLAGNFNQLNSDEKVWLLEHFKQVESKNPARVYHLRKQLTEQMSKIDEDDDSDYSLHDFFKRLNSQI